MMGKNMRKFESLTKYLYAIDLDDIGTVVYNPKKEGHSLELPYVKYTDMVYLFIKDVYDFSDKNKDFELDRYDLILSEYGIEKGGIPLDSVDVLKMDGRGVMALIMAVVRAERFYEGTLRAAFKKGIMRKWLERLKEIDSIQMP